MNSARTPIFTVYSHSLFKTAIDSAERMREGRRDILNCAVMSVTSAEAFINEAHYVSTFDGAQPYELDSMGRLPRFQWSFRQKFEEILKPLVPNFSWRDKPYSNLSLAYGLRNAIAHLDHVDEFAHQNEGSPTEILLPRQIQPFYELNLLKKVPKESWESWFELIQTQRLAWWLCAATRDSIAQILTESPKEFSRKFETWRDTAVQELPRKPLNKKLGNDGSKLKVLRFAARGNIVYECDKNSRLVIFSSTTKDCASSINAVDEILNAIQQNEDISTNEEYSFYDFQTCMGYQGLHSGEYRLSKLKTVAQGDQFLNTGWKDVQELLYVQGKLHLFERGEVPSQVQASISKFSGLVGKTYPF